MRKLATVEQIVSVNPIEGADRIEAIGVPDRVFECIKQEIEDEQRKKRDYEEGMTIQ